MREWSKCNFLTGREHLKECFDGVDRSLLIMGKGFDPRACRGLEVLADACIDLEIWLIDYNEKGTIPNDGENESRSLKNFDKIKTICKGLYLKDISAPMYKINSSKKTLIISESVRTFMTDSSMNKYEKIIIDISAMPRAVSFSVIKRALDVKNEKQKLYIIVCENSDCDDNIKPVIVEGSAEYLQGFNTFSMQVESDDDETIWLPILGMNEKPAFNIIDEYLKPVEICPIIPFPAKNIRRGENILRYYGQTLFRERNIEKRNIIYVPEYAPLLVFEKLYGTVKYYEKALNFKKNKSIKYAFSSQSSKLIDIGMLMAIVALKDEKIKTGIVIVENQGYNLNEDYDEDNEELYCVCLDNYEFEW